MRGRVNAIRTFKGLVADLRFIFLSIKLLCRFKEQGYAFFFTISLSTYPMLAKLFFCIGYKTLARICDINRISVLTMFFYLIDNNEMILVPMDDARQWSLFGKRFKA